jgi:hypothetical protein
LCSGIASKKAVTGGKLICVDLEIAGIDVNNHKLALITLFNLRAHIPLVKFVTTAREFFFIAFTL